MPGRTNQVINNAGITPMNYKPHTTLIWSQTKWKNIILIYFYNSINIASFILCFHFATIIRSDGPGGFAEIIIKSLILHSSIISLCAGIVLSIKQHLSVKPSFFTSFTCLLITMLLMVFAALGIIEACSDNKGYCRNWKIAVAHGADVYAQVDKCA